MRSFFKAVSLKRKIAVGLLAALFLGCAAFMGFSALTSRTETASATNVNTRIINSGSSSDTTWIYSANNSNAFAPASANGAVLNLVVHPNVADGSVSYRSFYVSFAPDSSASSGFVWGQSTTYGLNSGRFMIEFMVNEDINGIYTQYHVPNGAGGSYSTGYMQLSPNIWNAGATVSQMPYFTLNIVMAQFSGVWDVVINDRTDLSLVTRIAANGWGANGFSAFIGPDYFTAGRYNFAVRNKSDLSAVINKIDVYYGGCRAIDSAENTYIQARATRWVTPYAASANAYGTIEGSLVQLNDHGGYVDFAFLFTSRPYTGGYPIISIAFSPDGTCYFSDSDGTLGSNGRFYVNVMINGDNGGIYVSPHFYKGMSESNSTWKLLGTLNNGGIFGIRFKFVAAQGGWGFKISDTSEATTFDFTSNFQRYVTQSAVMSGGCSINVGAAGFMNNWSSNYASVYWITNQTSGANLYNGYDVRTNSSAIMEVLTGSPAERVSYYDDANSHSAGSYLNYTSGFKANFSVVLTSAITSDQAIQICFGPDNTVMNAGTTSQSGIGYAHFTVVMTLHSNGNLYATVYYKLSSNTWTELAGTEYGKIKPISLTSGSTINFTIAVRKLNSVAYNGNSSTYGLFVDDVLIDATNFNSLFNSRSPKFVTGTNKNIAITADVTNSFSNFPGNVYLLSVAADTSAKTFTSVNTATICDVSTSSTYNTAADTVSATGGIYYYGATSTTQSAYITFEFTAKYTTSAGIVAVLNATSASPTTGAGIIINSSSGINIIVGNNSSNYTVTRKNPLANNTTYTFRLTVAKSSSLVYVGVCIVNGSTVTYSMEAVGEAAINTSSYTIYLGGASGSVSFNTITNHRAAFDNNGTVTSLRFTTTAVTAPSITGVATYYTGYWYKGGTFNSTNKRTPGASTGDTSSAVYVRKDMMSNTTQISAQLNAVSSGALVAKSGLWRDSVSGSMSTTKGYLAFMHNMSKTLYNSLESAVSSGKITGFKIHVLFGNSSGTNVTPTATSGNPGSINCKLKATCVDTEEKTKLIYGADSNNYSFVGYIGIGVANKSVIFQSVLCVEIIQLDGTHTYVLSNYSSSTGQQSLKGAATTALTTYSGTLTAAQKAAIANYK
ncbi:MAG: hypothetical protein SPL13_02515 [Clostridia bacterium]|nr:hypothetical protein [Clostridia bacterium]